MIFDHLGIKVSDFDKSHAFYKAALAPLGIKTMMQYPGVCGMGVTMPEFWLSAGAPVSTHVAFAAKDRATVDAFYAAAIAAGGKDNGGPGLRPNYHEHYYGAFVLDLDGNNIEAVCHLPPGAKKAPAKAAPAAKKKAPAKKIAAKKKAPAKKAGAKKKKKR
jgi:catechol 2,3-dioxygenase-like lactoylglutathione lyase family enzyme